MKVVARTDEYTIFVKRNNRHAVRAADHQWIHGDEKVRILLEKGLIKLTPKTPEPEPVVEPEAPAADTTADAEATDAADAAEGKSK